MPVRNELLRAARERMESPSCPGEPLTRQELADLVNAQVYRTTQKVSAVDANHVGKWENGRFWWPAAHYRNALRTVLDVGTDAELGFRRPSRGKSDDVDRRALLKTALGAGAGAMAVRHLPGPTIDADDLAAAIMGPTAHYRRMESAVSSDQLAPAVDAHLRLASDIVTSKMRNSTGYGVLSEIAGLAAWLAVDRNDRAAARNRYAEAVAHAERAHHPLLAAYMTASLGHFAVEAGHARQGVTLLDRAANQLNKTAPTSARAWLASLHAVGHATLGNRTAALISLRAAERLTSRQRGEPHWPWVFGFDRAKAARYHATTLGRLGDLRAARDAYASADTALSAAKPRALAQVDLAQALAAAGLIGEGCQLAADAFAVGRDYGSERITNRVREFRASLPDRTVEASELDDVMAALYDGENT